MSPAAVEYDVTFTDQDAERIGIRRTTYTGTGRRREPASVETITELSRLEVVALVGLIAAALVALPDGLSEDVAVAIPGLPEMTRYAAGQLASALLRYLV